MNKSYLYIGVAIVIALAVLGYIYIKPEGDDSLENETENAETEDDATSLQELVSRGEPVRCNFSRSDANSEMTGVTYIGSGKVRGEFDVTLKTGTTAGQKTTSYMIIDGENMYIWSSAMPQGMKMKVDAQAGADAQAGQQTAINYQDELNYDCDSWDTSPNTFELPSGVTFMDLNIPIPGTSGAPNVCASCDVITDTAAKAQCKVSLNCN